MNALQTVVSREVNPLEPAVLSVTTFQAGTTSNVIPASAHLSGTARTFSPTLREAYPGILRRVARGVGETSRAKIRTEYHFGPPPTINDAACVDTGRRACETVFGKDHVVDWELQMGGEDFAKYDNPKALLLLGGGFADASRRYPQHSPHYDIDERALYWALNILLNMYGSGKRNFPSNVTKITVNRRKELELLPFLRFFSFHTKIKR